MKWFNSRRRASKQRKRLMFESLERRELLAADMTLVKDINPLLTSQGSSPGQFQFAGTTTFFVAHTTSFGSELWKTDGTSEGTRMVKDIRAGSAGSFPRIVASDLNTGIIYFWANDGIHGAELWKSDGTEEGTTLVKDVNPGIAGSGGSSVVYSNGILYFTSTDSLRGNELWRSDGTEAGTTIVKDIYAGSNGSNPGSLTLVNSTLFFSADTESNGLQLWKSDGTESGTVLVKDLSPGSNFSGPSQLTNVNGTLYFISNESLGLTELWKSDGTTAGTEKVADVSSPNFLRAVDGTLFFTSDRDQLWKSDGTAAGTVMIKDINPSSNFDSAVLYTSVGGSLYFGANDGVNGNELWKSDGTTQGTVLIKDIAPGPASAFVSFFAGFATNVNDTIFFTAFDGTRGTELWKTDGTAEGTVLVADINSSGSSSPASLANINGSLYFRADNGLVGSELWKSDGTTSGTVLIKDILADGADATLSMPVKINNTLYFSANDGVNGAELWKTDGTESGTTMVKNIHPTSSFPSQLTNVNGQLFFRASDTLHGEELWKSDGTEQGTQLVKDLAPGTANSFPSLLTEAGGILYFSIQNDSLGFELWRSDGTESGTHLVRDIRPGTAGSNPNRLTNVNGTLFFYANDGVSGDELWKSNGTEAGTVRVKDINPGPSSAFNNIDRLFANINGTLFFIANDGINGRELWKSDGTDVGTVMVKNIRPGAMGAFEGLGNLLFTSINGTLYFTANDGIAGVELWKSDGTEAGTVLVKDIHPGSASTALGNFASAGGRLFFTATENTSDNELWVSDGTSAGTVRVKDILPGSGGSNPSSLTDVNGTLFFRANDGLHGVELWKSDGTEAGTQLVFDLASGPASSSPEPISFLNNFVIVSATTSQTGRELFRVNFPNSAPVLDISKNPILSPVMEDATNPNGNSIESLLIGSTDADVGNLKGIALTTVTGAATGKWQYTLNNGASWTDVGVVSPSSALLLPAVTNQSRLRYLPNPNFNGSAQIRFRAWDQTQGLPEQKINLAHATSVGAHTAFSSAIETVSLAVLAVNDAPVLNTAANPILTAIMEDASNPSGNPIQSLLVGATDVDTSALRGIALTSTTGTATGQWQYTLDGGATWVNVGTVSTASALLIPQNGALSRLRYLPNPDFNGNVQVQFRAWDQTQGAVGQKVNVSLASLVGRTTAYSAAIDAAILSILPVNDAPVLDNSLTPTLTPINEDAVNPAGNTVHSLLAGASDVDAGARRGLALIAATGTNTGKWQYTLDAGATWQDIGTVSSSSALLLPSDGNRSRLRYLPNRDFDGTAQIVFRAWDQTQGTSGATISLANATSVGRTTAFSLAIETATVTVNPVNDAPQILSPLPLSLGSIKNTQAASAGYLLSSALQLSTSVGDVDRNALRGIAIHSIPAANQATLWYQLNGTTTWVQVTNASLSSALLLPGDARIQFRPVQGFVGIARIGYRAWDRTTGLNAGRVNLGIAGSTGGTTAFSSTSGLAELTITP